jgi:hypothetical protein
MTKQHDLPKCPACGRLLSRAKKSVYHRPDLRETYYRCECGKEWTLTEPDVNPYDPVSSDEVIEVHKQLDADVTIDELLRGNTS